MSTVPKYRNTAGEGIGHGNDSQVSDIAVFAGESLQTEAPRSMERATNVMTVTAAQIFTFGGNPVATIL